MNKPLPKCEICYGPVYRRLARVEGGEPDWVGELWHLGMDFLNAEDPGHDVQLADAPERIALIGD